MLGFQRNYQLEFRETEPLVCQTECVQFDLNKELEGKKQKNQYTFNIETFCKIAFKKPYYPPPIIFFLLIEAIQPANVKFIEFHELQAKSANSARLEHNYLLKMYSLMSSRPGVRILHC